MIQHGLLLLRPRRVVGVRQGTAFDRHLVKTMLDVRQRYDACSAIQWPAGSVERVQRATEVDRVLAESARHSWTSAGATDEGSVPLYAVRAWWDSR